MRLIVASASPRRHALLAGLGLTFDVRPADVDEAAAAGGRAAEAAVLAVVRPTRPSMPAPWC
jgi:septum formation protein